MCRNCRGENHFGNGEEHLTEQQAREQLQHSLRRQLGTLTFRTDPYDNPDEEYGDGIVFALINGEQVDHFIYHEEQ